MANIKKILSILIVLVFAQNVCSVAGSVSIQADAYSQDVQFTIDSMELGEVIETKVLYNVFYEPIAFYLGFNNGYLIYGLNGTVIEYSDESKPCFTNSNSDIYYAGPLQYFFKDENSFVNFGSNEKLSFKDLAVCNKNFENVSAVSSIMYNEEYSVNATSTPDVSTKQLTAPKRCFYWNTDGTCGSLAITMLIIYYSDVRNLNLVIDYFLNYPRAMYDQLKRYVEYNGDLCPIRESTINGSDPTSRQLGLDAFLSTYGTAKGKKMHLSSDDKMSLLTMARMVIGMGGAPGIIAWDTDGNKSLDHEVFTYGYREIWLGDKFIRSDFIVNDGWSQSKVFINMDYCGYFQYF